MTIKWIEDWSMQAASADVNGYGKWEQFGSSWTWGSTKGPRGGYGVEATGNSGYLAIDRNLMGITNNNADPLCLAFEIKISAPPATTVNFLSLGFNGAAGADCWRINSSGQIVMYNSSNVLQATGALNFCDGNRHWICTTNTVGNSTGTQKFWIDGSLQINNPAGIGNFSVSQFMFTGLASRTVNLGNLYAFLDGGSVYNSGAQPLSDRQLLTVFPQGAGSSTQFSPSAGSNYQCVDEQAASLSDYVESGTSGNKDYYDFAALGVSPASIYSVTTKLLAGNPNPGSISLRQNARSSGGTVSNGASQAIVVNPKYYEETFLTEPGGASWTETKVNGAEFGFEVI